MPMLTRGAAARLDGASVSEDVNSLCLRESVSGRAGAVWAVRGGKDAYSGASKAQTEKPNVDHVLEVQLVENVLVRTFNAQYGRCGSMATAQAGELIREALNDMSNLNVTSSRINQAKRGPFTAAMNRLQSDKLRSISMEQLVRQGKNGWMLDGTWQRISAEVVRSYESIEDALVGSGVDAMPGADKLVEGAVEELSRQLHVLGFV